MFQVHELLGYPETSHRHHRRIFDLDTRILEACTAASMNLGGVSLRTLGVTSSVRGEGRSTIAVAMAMVQAREYGRKTLLVEMDDFDRPCLAYRLGVDPRPGLGELVEGSVSIAEVQQPIRQRLNVIPVGDTVNDANRLLVDALRAGLVRELAEHCEVLVVDLPPLLAGSIARLAAAEFERVLVVARAAITPVAQIRQALTYLPGEPAVLLNDTYSKLPRWLRQMRGI